MFISFPMLLSLDQNLLGQSILLKGKQNSSDYVFLFLFHVKDIKSDMLSIVFTVLGWTVNEYLIAIHLQDAFRNKMCYG